MPFLFVPVHLWSLQLWPLNLAFLTHLTPFLYVLFCHTAPQDTIEFLHVFHALTLISDQAWIILARGRLHKCWISQPLTMSAPLLCSLTHNCPPTTVLLFILALPLLSIFDSSFFVILRHTRAACARVSVRDGEEVYTMNNSWCGFLVSETDGGDGELALRSFSPITYCS